MQTAPIYWQIAPDLFLAHQPTNSAASAQSTAPEPVHHVLVLDCSGSMYSDLPLIREQLKSKLPTLLGEDDTITLIWFSGRGECGILFEAVKPTLKDLADINRAIDRWLRPVGLTGFKLGCSTRLNRQMPPHQFGSQRCESLILNFGLQGAPCQRPMVMELALNPAHQFTVLAG